LYSNGSCYRAYSTKLSWFDAAKFCRENKGELVSINSEGEQRFVYQSMAVNKTLWIGLVKDSGLQRFRWSTGEKLTYQNWIRGEGSISGHEDCGEMTDYSIFRGQWNDNSCSAKQTYICEKGNVKFPCSDLSLIYRGQASDIPIYPYPPLQSSFGANPPEKR